MTRKAKSNLVFYSVLIIIVALYYYKYKVTPDVSISDISFVKSGQKISLEDYSEKNLLICFFSSTCGPCMKEMPILNKIYPELKDKNFEIIALTNDKPEQIEAVRNRFKIDFDLFSLSESMTEYGIQSIPSIFVYNKDGDLVYKKTGMLPWKSSEISEELQDLVD